MLVQRLFEHKKKRRISFLSQVFKNEQRLYLIIKAVNQCRHCRNVGRVCLLLIKVYSCKIKLKKKIFHYVLRVFNDVHRELFTLMVMVERTVSDFFVINVEFF